MKHRGGRDSDRSVRVAAGTEPEREFAEARSQRWLAAAGIVGVGGFVSAWATRGRLVSGYHPVHDAISRLAAVDTPGRGWMSAGFISFGIGVPLFARALRSALGGPAWITATISGVATLGVAASPLGRHDTAHYVFASIGYVSLAATPLVAARTLRIDGAFTPANRTKLANWSTASGVASALLLTASTFDPAHGLTQRLGLGVVDLWIVACALLIIRGDVNRPEARRPTQRPTSRPSVG